MRTKRPVEIEVLGGVVGEATAMKVSSAELDFSCSNCSVRRIMPPAQELWVRPDAKGEANGPGPALGYAATVHAKSGFVRIGVARKRNSPSGSLQSWPSREAGLAVVKLCSWTRLRPEGAPLPFLLSSVRPRAAPFPRGQLRRACAGSFAAAIVGIVLRAFGEAKRCDYKISVALAGSPCSTSCN